MFNEWHQLKGNGLNGLHGRYGLKVEKKAVHAVHSVHAVHFRHSTFGYLILSIIIMGLKVQLQCIALRFSWHIFTLMV